MNTDIENLGKLKAYFEQLHNIENSLKRLQIHNKKFTLDGRLVGDFAEAFVITAFGLHPTDKTREGYDATTEPNEKGEKVEVKAIRAGHLAVSGRFQNCEAKYVIIVYIDQNSSELKPKIIYNGSFDYFKQQYWGKSIQGTDTLTMEGGLKMAEGFESYFE